jgi:catechol 2,3-dioxygenase-like lactoylglutathione lyase family enzyme
MTVSDMDAALNFYLGILGFQKILDRRIQDPAYARLHATAVRGTRVVRLRLGSEEIELTDYDLPEERPIPADSRSNDLWFQHIALVVSDIDKAYALLRRSKVQHVSSGPQTLPANLPAAAGIKAFYFRDPDGHNLELIQFPPGKGDPRWQHSDGRLFLGIDHTAIAVAETDRSLRFYRDLLGLRVAGTSENYGSEQEHLNGVFGSRVLITGLRSQDGPGIEFLHYLAPPGGRQAPADGRATDLMHWQTTLEVADLEGLRQRLRREGIAFLSPGIVALQESGLGFRRALLIRDPDGHALRVVQR